jgi:DNA-directed RNA polymerase subunit RPC12/RpoP
MAFGQEGRKAIVYQLERNGQLFALKIFKPVYREPYLVDTCQALSQLTLRGLEVCTRQCLTSHGAKSLIEQCPDVEYAVLMPWVDGSTWFDILFSGTKISQDESQGLAKSTVEVLAGLEQRGFAHCDIAGGNVIVHTTTGSASLIDVEDMFGPGLPPPGSFPQGTGGYQHQASRTAKWGQWCAEGDRFSAAVLLVEMLTWHHPQIRQEADGEHYFAEGELQDPNSLRYKLAVEILASISPQIADCFERAWRVPTLAEAPALGEWAELLKPIKAPILPEPPVEEAESRYQCINCRAQFEEPVAGGRCPRCGGKRVKQTAIASRPARRSISGFRCLACGREAEHPTAGGRCPNCGSNRMVQTVIQAVSRPIALASQYECPVCQHCFAQLAWGGRCSNCGVKINAR